MPALDLCPADDSAQEEPYVAASPKTDYVAYPTALIRDLCLANLSERDSTVRGLERQARCTYKVARDILHLRTICTTATIAEAIACELDFEIPWEHAIPRQGWIGAALRMHEDHGLDPVELLARWEHAERVHHEIRHLWTRQRITAPRGRGVRHFRLT